MTVVYTLKVVFVSWMVGHASTLVLQKVFSINTRLQFDFVATEKMNALLGVGICKRVLAGSFLQYFNRSLRIRCRKPGLRELVEVREAMTYAETVHLIAFVCVLGIAVMNIIRDEHHGMTATICAVNIVVNLYPVLVQQMNRRRIDRVIRTMTVNENRYDVG